MAEFEIQQLVIDYRLGHVQPFIGVSLSQFCLKYSDEIVILFFRAHCIKSNAYKFYWLKALLGFRVG